jgi:plasmid stabilization system protein ParE
MTDEVDKIYVVRTTARAHAAIREQMRYITVDQNSPQNAAAWVDRVWTSIDRLQKLPRRHPLAAGYEQISYVVRRMVLGKHLILFTVDEA